MLVYGVMRWQRQHGLAEAMVLMVAPYESGGIGVGRQGADGGVTCFEAASLADL